MEKKKVRLVKTADGKNYLVPFVLITTLFFLWGFAHSILDVLNKHFQDVLHISKAGSALVQATVYGSYFLMALPVGEIIRRKGYRTGVLLGLVLYGVGALMFIPGSYMESFPFFLLSLFIVGCGLACLETSANPYATVLGDKEAAERRINFAQAFNGLGWIFGPLIGGLFLFADDSDGGSIAVPYTIIGIIVLIVAVVFTRVKLPEIDASTVGEKEEVPTSSPSGLWKNRAFKYGLLALFLYVAAQTGINSFFINYMTDKAGISAHEASVWLSFGGMGLFMIGRMLGSWVMQYIRADRLMTYCGWIAALSMVVVIYCDGRIGMFAFFCCYLCESIMYPTIFSLSIRNVGSHTKRASSYLVMCVVGGAITPIMMGYIADYSSIAYGFFIPLVCFIGVALYSAFYSKL